MEWHGDGELPPSPRMDTIAAGSCDIHWDAADTKPAVERGRGQGGHACKPKKTPLRFLNTEILGEAPSTARRTELASARARCERVFICSRRTTRLWPASIAKKGNALAAFRREGRKPSTRELQVKIYISAAGSPASSAALRCTTASSSSSPSLCSANLHAHGGGRLFVLVHE